MAVTQRRVVTTSTVESRELKQNLSSIADELRRAQEEGDREAQSLQRIQGLLDSGQIGQLLRSVEELEVRMSGLEAETLATAADVDAARAELRQEQARLEKLWAAYKVQEDELAAVKAEAEKLVFMVNERNTVIDTMRNDTSAWAAQETRMTELNREVEAMAKEIELVTGDLARAHDREKLMESQALNLREQAAPADLVAGLEAELAEERERLVKLYKVYESLDAERKELRTWLAAWDDWFHEVQPHIEQVCAGATQAPHHH